jgi:predicted nucleic acid-binding protein
MNRYLFDSSAIITLVESSKLDELLEGWTIDLAFYELGNAVWKQVHLYRTLSMDEAKIALDALVSVFDKMRKIQELEPLSTLVIAVTEGLSYHDAAYLQAAVDKKMILVTDDKTLRQVGGKYVNTVTSREAI